MSASSFSFQALYEQSKFPKNHMHHELPYRYFDDEHHVFENTASMGFGLKMSVLVGANDEVIQTLNSLMLNLKEGPDWDYQFVLVGNNQVEHLIDANCETLSRRGGIMEKFAKNEAIYAKHASKYGFKIRSKIHYYDLKNYELFFFTSTTKPKDELVALKNILESELAQIGFNPQPMKAQDLICYVHDHVNFNPTQTKPTELEYNSLDCIHEQVMSPDTTFGVHDESVVLACTALQSKQQVQTHVTSLGLKKLPSEMRLYQLPEMLASVLNPEKSLVCPHRVSVNFRILSTGRESLHNTKKMKGLDKIVHSPMRMFVPQAEDELIERRDLQRGLLEQAFKVGAMMLTVSLYTTEQKQLESLTKAISTFEKAKLDMVSTKKMQINSFLAVLPFQMSEGFFDDCKKFGRFRSIKTSNLVNFLPVVAELKNFSGGMLLPTMRHQLSFFDPFNCGCDNYNIALTGGSGSGKSFFMQSLAKSVYGRGGKVWILDKGASYKKLTQTLGGVYMDHTQIRLNPFTHLGHIGHVSHEEGSQGNEDLQLVLQDIVGLFAAMAAPNTDLADYEQAMLGDAIIQAYQANKNKTVVDDVQKSLHALATQNNDDQRLKDLVAQLSKYSTQGIYGQIFNEPSQLDPKIDITTLELDGFADDLLRPVVFALLVTINQQMYLAGGRTTPKMCIIEEAWSLMSGANRQARAFIDKGYRTARKFGGSYVSVTQGIEDFFCSDEAKAAFNNSDIHITLRQGQAFNKFLKDNPNHFNPYEEIVIKSFKTAAAAGHSCCMIKAGGLVTFHRVFADAWTRSLLSTEPREYEFCENLIHQGVDILEAVEQTAQHFYPQEMHDFDEIKRLHERESEGVL